MHVKKQFLALAVAAVAASFVAVPTAGASEVANCSFSGLAGAINPIIPPAPVTGGSGTYNFGGDALNCTYSNSATPGNVINTTAHITSTGRFENDICSTGRAFGHTKDNPNTTAVEGTKIDFANPAVPDITQVDYRIDFVGGVGALRGGNLVTKDDGSGATGTVNNDSSWRATGEINIRPHAPGNCVTAGVDAFDVTGNFHAAR